MTTQLQAAPRGERLLCDYVSLRSKSVDELVELYDKLQTHTPPSLSFIRDEIVRRENEKHTAAITQLTKTMTTLTWVITALTALNLVVAAIPAFR